MRKRLVLLCVAATAVAGGCARTADSTDEAPEMKSYEKIATVRLTVAEGKRLIAKGIAANPAVRDRLEKGIVIITRGTTNTYIAEQLADLDAPRGAFVTGHIVPNGSRGVSVGIEPVGEIILLEGKRSDIGYSEALAMMGPDDIVFKGANMLNYSLGQAAVNIGAPDGGTVGRLRAYTDKGNGRWIVPVGLEKDTSWDLTLCARVADDEDADRTGTVLLNIKKGDIYTEIEAIREFADVDVYPSATGGVRGAEGGVSLMICGSREQVEAALEAVAAVYGEQAF